MTEDTQNRWNWKEKREQKAFLALEDGSVYRGYAIGAPTDRLGEVVFNTSMTGYQEILTDPSYNGQLVTMTYTQIGNTGINSADMESRRAFASGFIIHEETTQSNFRTEETLRQFLIREDIPGIAGLDTRALTCKLRDKGTLKGYIVTTGNISPEKAIEAAQNWQGLDGQDYASHVTCAESYQWDTSGEWTCSWGVADSLPPADLKIAAYDFGMKWNILRRMRLAGMEVTVYPCTTPPDELLRGRTDGVFLSNGPADPAGVKYAVDNIRYLIGKVPIMGICLGHQLLGLACNAETFRLKFGHHGANHPVKDLQTGSIEITTQNHNFAVDMDTLDPSKVELTHLNLNDNTTEGIAHKREPMCSFQYHPEAGPGPHDSSYLFKRFRDMIENA